VQIEEQVKLLQKGVTHIGVGTPGRIGTLIENGRCGQAPLLLLPLPPSSSRLFLLCPEGLSLQALKYVVLDWNWRDQKLRRMVDVPEVSCCPLLDTRGCCSSVCGAMELKTFTQSGEPYVTDLMLLYTSVPHG